MENKSLLKFLEEVIILSLKQSADSPEPDDDMTGTRSSFDIPPKDPEKLKLQAGDLQQHGKQIAEGLLRQAMASGLELATINMNGKSLKGGNTAEFVGEITLTAPFVFKMDRESRKLADEGLAIQQIKRNTNLSQRYRDAWPIVYAVHSESPYAYLMEYLSPSDGWHSLEDNLYPQDQNNSITPVQASRLIHSVLDVLFEGYRTSLNRRHSPSVKEDYYLRIKDRLEETAKKDARFNSVNMVVNGKKLKPWREYLEMLEKNSTYLSGISAPFITIVHGDPNPGNLMIKSTDSETKLKLIDPKEWITGDYLFDICKITHFIEGTGPIEKPADKKQIQPLFTSSSTGNMLTYIINRPTWTQSVVDACLDRVRIFAERNGDAHWEKRYALGMASNLLGLPLGRLGKGRIDAALALYGEGLLWLDTFCKNLSN